MFNKKDEDDYKEEIKELKEKLEVLDSNWDETLEELEVERKKKLPNAERAEDLGKRERLMTMREEEVEELIKGKSDQIQIEAQHLAMGMAERLLRAVSGANEQN